MQFATPRGRGTSVPLGDVDRATLQDGSAIRAPSVLQHCGHCNHTTDRSHSVNSQHHVANSTVRNGGRGGGGGSGQLVVAANTTTTNASNGPSGQAVEVRLESTQTSAGAIVAVASVYEGEIVCTAERGGVVRLRDPLTGAVIHHAKMRLDREVTSIAGHHNELWIGANDGVMVVYDVEQKRVKKEMSLHQQAVTSIVSLPSGVVVSASLEGLIGFWQASQYKRASSIATDAGVLCLTYAAPAHVFAGCTDGAALGWNLSDLRHPTHVFEGHSGAVLSIASTANFVWTGGEDATIRAWSVDKRICAKLLRYHAGPVHALMANSGEYKVWSASTDGRIAVWDSLTFAQLYDLPVSYGSGFVNTHTGVNEYTAVLAPIARASVWRVWTCSTEGTVMQWNSQATDHTQQQTAVEVNFIPPDPNGLEELNALRARIFNLQNAEINANNEIARLKADVERLQSELQSEGHRKAAALEEIEGELRRYKEDLRASQKAAEELQLEKSRLLEEERRLRNEFQDQALELHRMQSELQRYKDDSVAAHEENLRLVGENHLLRQEIAQFPFERSRLQNEIQLAQSAAAFAQEETERFRNENKKLVDEMGRVRDEASAAQNEAHQAKADAQRAIFDAQRAADEATRWKNEATRSQDENQKLTAELHHMKAEGKHLAAEKKRLADLLKDVEEREKDAAAAFQEKIRELEATVAEGREKIAMLTKAFEQKERELAEKLKDLEAKFKKESKEAADKCTQLEGELDRAKDHLKDFAALEAKLKSVEATLRNAQEEMRKQDLMLEDGKRARAELERKLKLQQDETDKKAEEIKGLRKLLEDAEQNAKVMLLEANQRVQQVFDTMVASMLKAERFYRLGFEEMEHESFRQYMKLNVAFSSPRRQSRMQAHTLIPSLEERIKQLQRELEAKEEELEEMKRTLKTKLGMPGRLSIAEFDRLQQELTDMQNTLRSRNSEKLAAEAELHQARLDLQNALNEKRMLQEQCAEFEKANGILNGQLKAKSAELAEVSRRLDDAQINAATQEKRFKALQEEAKMLSNKVEDLEAERTLLRNAHSQLEEELSSLRENSKRQLDSIMRQKSQKIEELEHLLSMAQRDAKAAQAEASTVRNDNDAKALELSKLRKEKAVLLEKIQELEEQLQTLSRTSKAKIAELEAQRTNAEEIASAAQRAADQERTRASALAYEVEEKLKSMGKVLKEKQKALDDACSRNEQQTAELDKLRRAHDVAQSTINSLEHELKLMRDRAANWDDLNAKYQEAQLELARVRPLADQLQKELEATRSENLKLEREVQRLKDGQNNDELDAAQRAIMALKENLSAVENANEELNAERRALQFKLQEVTESRDRLDMELEAVQRRLKTENKELRDRVGGLEAQINSLAAQVKATADAPEIRNELEQVKKQLNQTKNELRQTEERLYAAEAERNQLQHQLQLKQQGWDEQNDQNTAMLRKMKQELSALSSELESTRADNHALLRQVKGLEDAPELRLELETLRKQFAVAKAKLQSAEEELEALKKEKIYLQHQVTELATNLDELTTSSTAAAKKARLQISEYQDEIDVLRREVTNLSRQVKANEDAPHLRDENADLKRQLNSLKATNSELNDALKSITSEKQGLSQAHESLSSALRKLKEQTSDYDDLKRRLQALDAEKSEMLKQLSARNALLNDAEMQEKSLQSDLLKAHNEIKLLQDRLKSESKNNKTVDELQNMISTLQHQLSLTEGEKRRMEGTISALESEIRNLKSELDASMVGKRLRDEVMALNAKLEELAAENSGLARQVKANSDAPSLREEVDKLNRQLSQLKHELKSTEDELFAAQQEKNYLSAQLQEKTKALQDILDDSGKGTRKLKEELIDSRKNNELAQEEIAALQRNLKHTQAQLHEATLELDNITKRMKAEAAKWAAAIEERDTELAKMLRELKMKTAELEASKENFVDPAGMSKLKHAVIQLEETVASLEAEKSSLTKKVKALMQQLEDQGKLEAKLREQIKQMSAEGLGAEEQLRKELESAKSELRKVKDRMQQMEDEYTRDRQSLQAQVVAEFNDLEQQLMKKDSEIKRLMQAAEEVEQLRVECEKLRLENARLQAHLTGLSDNATADAMAMKEVHAKLINAQRRAEDATLRADEMQRRYEDAHRRVDELTIRNEDLQRRGDEQTRRAEDALKNIDELHRRIEDGQRRVEDAEAELLRMRQIVTDRESRLERLSEQLGLTDKKYRDTRAEAAEHLTSAEQMRADLLAMRQPFESLKHALHESNQRVAGLEKDLNLSKMEASQWKAAADALRVHIADIDKQMAKVTQMIEQGDMRRMTHLMNEAMSFIKGLKMHVGPDPVLVRQLDQAMPLTLTAKPQRDLSPGRGFPLPSQTRPVSPHHVRPLSPVNKVPPPHLTQKYIY